MTPTEQDKELRALLGEMPYFIIDWLELSDDLRNEWKKGGKASDFGGHRTFIQKYEKKIADFSAADRKRVVLEARIDALEYAKISPKFKIEERIEALKQELESL